MSNSLRNCIRASIPACLLVALLQWLLEVAGFSVLYSGYIFRPQDVYKSQILLLTRRVLHLSNHSSLPSVLDQYLGPTLADKIPFFITLLAIYIAIGLVTGLLLGAILWFFWNRRKGGDFISLHHAAFSIAFASWLPCNGVIYLTKILEQAKYSRAMKGAIYFVACLLALLTIYILHKLIYRLLHRSPDLESNKSSLISRIPLYAMIPVALFSVAVFLIDWRASRRPVMSLPKPNITQVSDLNKANEPNIILISIDSLRADHLSTYGYARNTTPNIDTLAKEGTVFTSAFSDTSWTLPAHRSLLTSTFAEATDFYTYWEPIRRDQTTLAEVLRKNGYTTAGFVSGPLLGSRYGFKKGFQLYDDFTIHFDNADDSHSSITSPALHQSIEKWLQKKPAKFFLFLHYWDVHYDYMPPAPYDRMFDPDYKGTINAKNFIHNKAITKDMDPKDFAHIVALYDGEIAFVDSYLGRLFQILKNLNLYDNSLIVVTADHGDEFFEHGKKGHMRTLYDEVIHIPLIMKFPSNSEFGAGKRINDLVSIVDIMPTVLSYLGANIPSGAQGKTLLPNLRGERVAQNDYIFASLRNELYALRSSRTKFIQRSNFPKKEFYDLIADPKEKEDIYKPGNDGVIASSNRQILMLLDLLNLQRKYLRSHPPVAEAETEMDDSVQEQLKALGYIQ